MKRRRFDESKVHRWPAHAPQSKGGEFAPEGAPGTSWMGAVEARLPRLDAPGGPTPVRPRAGRPPAKAPAVKPSTPPRPAARLIEQAQAAGWTATVKYTRRPKSGDRWTVTLQRGGATHVAAWTKNPDTGRARYDGEQRLKDLTAALDQPGTRLTDPGPSWIEQLSQRLGRRQTQPFGDMSDEQLRQAYDKILSASGPASDADLDAADEMWSELVRRDRERFEQGTGLDDNMELSPEQLQVDELIARGVDFLTAVEQVYGNVDLVDRRAGETRAKAIRRMYEEWAALSYLAAESFTNGHMVNPLGRDRHVKGKPAPISPRSLFSGPTARAAKYASPELLEFWETHPRMTLEQFTAYVSRQDSREARKARERLQDLGLKS